MLNKLKIKFLLFIVNNLLKGTRFFKLKREILNLCGYKIGEDTKIVGPINIPVKLKLNIGKNCWIGRAFTIDGNGEVNIKNNIDIAPEVLISTGSHELGNRERRAGVGKKLSTTIDDGCWIGTRALIIEGANIAKGSIVGAGSVVNKTYIEDSLIVGKVAEVKKSLESKIIERED